MTHVQADMRSHLVHALCVRQRGKGRRREVKACG